MNERTIFIVDDNAEFRASAQWWLSSAGYDVVDFADPDDALQSLCESPPSGPACLLLDVRMPGMSGLDLHDRLNEHGLHLPVIYMTGHGDVGLAVQAMQKGAVTFLEKPFVDASLEKALELAFKANPNSRSGASASVDPAAERAWSERLAQLTPREAEVLDWVLQDKLNKTISDLMGISIKTVELHRARVMHKLGAVSLTHLIKMAVSERVI